MTIKSIQYSESIESVNDIGLKRWRKAGIEIEIEPHDFLDGEVPQVKVSEEAYNFAKLLVKEAIKNSPSEPPDYVSAIPGHPLNEKTIPVKMEDAINSCTDMTVLVTYKLLVKGKPELQAVYDKKVIELSK